MCENTEKTLIKYFSTDIFFELLKYLDRNEIEKCQLVSKLWDANIKNDSTVLPLHRIEVLTYGKGKVGIELDKDTEVRVILEFYNKSSKIWKLQ